MLVELEELVYLIQYLGLLYFMLVVVEVEVLPLMVLVLVALEVSVCYIMCIRSGCELRTSTLWQTMHHKFTT